MSPLVVGMYEVQMDVGSLDIGDIVDPNSCNKDNYKFIETIKFEQEITRASANLRQELSVDYFSISLVLPNNRKYIISNNPGNIAIPYQVNGLHRLDNVFEHTSYEGLKKDYFHADNIRYDSCSKLYLQIMNERFNVFNAYGFMRNFVGFQFIIVFARKKQTQILKCNYAVEKKMVNFVNQFLDQILPVYANNHRSLKYSRFYQDKSFRHNFIQGKYKNIAPQLRDRECDCLFWARYGKSTSEIADILDLKRSTIKNYLESVREKFGVSSVQEAITLAMQYQMIS